MTKKTLLVSLLVAIFLLAILVVPVKAATITEADVEDWTRSDSLHNAGNTPKMVKTTDTDGTIVLTYNAAELKILNGDSKRPDGYAWIGVKVKNVPEDATAFTVNGKKYDILNSDGKFAEEFVGIKESTLQNATKEGKDIIYNLEFKFIKNESDEVGDAVKVRVVIKTEGITLYNKEDNAQVWNDAIYEEFAPKAEVPSEEPVKEELDETSKTGVIATDLIVAMALAMVSLVGIAITKK